VVGPARDGGARVTAGALATELAGIAAETGHDVEKARRIRDRLEAAFADGSLARTPLLDAMLADLEAALATDDRGKVGGKSAEAARFIVRAILRSLAAG
jgi:hypothetical protein